MRLNEFGIGSRGWNLCPAKAESQRFMRDYIDEMVFDFYPNADGLMIESSDYGICHCKACSPRSFDKELAFVSGVSRLFSLIVLLSPPPCGSMAICHG